MRKKPFQQIVETLSNDLSSEQLELLPEKWEKIGDVLILRLDDGLVSVEKDIAQVYAQVLHCKSVLKDTGGISGTLREPQFTFLYGDEETVTIHKENGVKFKIDPAKVMFSSGNMDERKRMADTAKTGEIVVDLFAGIGYFSIPIAVHAQPAKVYSCELNPTAFSFLKDNIRLNKVSHIVTPLLGDNRSVAPSNVADRVVMGFFGETYRFLPVAFQCLRNHKGIIHYHDTFPDKKIPDIALSQIQEVTEKYNRDSVLQHVQHVKSYAPGISHYVFDIKIVEKC